MKTAALIILPFLICCGGSATAPTLDSTNTQTQDGYTIRLHRPKQVGDRYHLQRSSTETKSETTFVGGEQVESKSNTIGGELSVNVTVLAVDEKGMPTQIKYDLVSSHQIVGDSKLPLLADGSSYVLTHAGGKTSYEPALELTKEQDAVLQLLVGKSKSGPTEDEAFGIDRPVQIGEAWQVSTEMADTLAKDANMTFAAFDSTVTLVKQSKIGEVPSLNIAANLGGKGTMNIKDGETQNKVTLKMALQGDFPEDVESRLLQRRSKQMNFNAEITVPSKGVQINLELSSSTESTTTPL